MLHPTVYNTAQICFQLGVTHAVMSPGSRNAPLTISFARHEGISKRIIPDERAAGFVALGIAQLTKSPVVLCCTSGSALLNYAPAIAEAYYREIPLIVISADRPPELIDQRDGQTIRQLDSLQNHVKHTYGLPVVSNGKQSQEYQQKLIEALEKSVTPPYGPVHVNIPFKEPFYPAIDQVLEYGQVEIKERDQIKTDQQNIDISGYKKIVVLIGQHEPDQQLADWVSKISKLVSVIRSPLNNLSEGVEHVDAFINSQSDLKPDLLITSGLSVLSKKLKNFLRHHKPDKHLHFDPASVEVDTYQTNPAIIGQFLWESLNEHQFAHADRGYLTVWRTLEIKAKESVKSFLTGVNHSESKAAFDILQSLPKDSVLHLSNSMPVRYADLFGVKEGVHCLSNRGTSGIDGCTSTAVGSSLVSDKMNILITGDLAFLYDRNALFHNYALPNFRIIILNNQGGGIFRLIDGPANLPELEDYFETRHNRTAEYICAENGITYLTASDDKSLAAHLNSFYDSSKTAKVLEVFTDPETNQNVYKKLKQYIHERIKD